jgi:hypothetical protein
MPKVGDVITRARCANCGEHIQERYFGSGGNTWEHTIDQRDACVPPKYAIPQPGSEVGPDEEPS